MRVRHQPSLLTRGEIPRRHGVGNFTPKSGLPNPGWPFSLEKKNAPVARLSSSTVLVKSWMDIFTKKSACGKTSQQHRTCRILDDQFQRRKRACGKTSHQQQGLCGPGQSAVSPGSVKFGPNWIQMDRAGCPDLSGSLPGVRTASQTQICLTGKDCLTGKEVQGD